MSVNPPNIPSMPSAVDSSVRRAFDAIRSWAVSVANNGGTATANSVTAQIAASIASTPTPSADFAPILVTADVAEVTIGTGGGLNVVLHEVNAATSYEIRYKTATGEYSYVSVYEPCTFSIHGLNIQTIYTVSVRAIGPWGASNWSESVSHQTGGTVTTVTNAYLTNSSHFFPSDYTGEVLNYFGATTTMKITLGGIDDSANWTIVQTRSAGITVTEGTGTLSPPVSSPTATVTAMDTGTDVATVTFTASRTDYADIVLVFTLHKVMNGGDASVFYLKFSSPLIAKAAPGYSTTGAHTPATMTCTATKTIKNITSTATGYYLTVTKNADAEDKLHATATSITITSAPTAAAYQYTVNMYAGAIGTDVTLSTLVDSQVIPVVFGGPVGGSGPASVTLTVYKRNATPGVPTGGSYDFTTNTLTPPATGWLVEQPDLSTTPTYASTGTFIGLPTEDAATCTWGTVYKDSEKSADGEYRDLVQIYAVTDIAVPGNAVVSYRFSDHTFIGLPTGWTASQPNTTTNPTYSTTALAYTSIPSIATPLYDWTTKIICAQKGAQGTGVTLLGTVATVGDLPSTGNTAGDMWVVSASGDCYSWDGTAWSNVGPLQGPAGQGVIKGIAFYRGASAGTLTATGSYASPTPTDAGWSDGVPADPSGLPLWMTTRIFTSDGAAPQQAAWTTPQKVGTPSTSSKLEFSVNGSTSWHETPTTNDYYMRTLTSTNNGVSWTAAGAVKIKGEQGPQGNPGADSTVQGPQGASGDSVDIIFTKYSATYPAAPATPSPSSGVPAYWYSTVPEIPAGWDGNIMWSSTGKKVSGASVYTWDAPVQMIGPSVAELTIYTRGNANLGPSAPTFQTAGGYTFTTPPVLTAPTSQFNTWTTAVPAVNGYPLFVSRAVVSAVAGYTMQISPTWTTPVISMQDGANGTNAVVSTNSGAFASRGTPTVGRWYTCTDSGVVSGTANANLLLPSGTQVPSGTSVGGKSLYCKDAGVWIMLTGDVMAENIVGTTITGKTIQTGASGNRLAIYSSSHSDSSLAGELHMWYDLGRGAGVEEIASIGLKPQTSGDDIIASFGASSANNNKIGVMGASATSFGVFGISDTNIAVHGSSNTGSGVYGLSSTGTGVRGGSSSGYSGIFTGGRGLYADKINVSASTPSEPEAGDIYYGGGHFYGYNGSVWKQLDNA